MGIFAKPDLIGNLGKLAISREVRMVQLKCRVGCAAHDAQCLAAGIGEDQSSDLGRCGHGAADEVVERRVGKFVATVADRIRNEGGLIDGRIEVPPQRHLL